MGESPSPPSACEAGPVPAAGADLYLYLRPNLHLYLRPDLYLAQVSDVRLATMRFSRSKGEVRLVVVTDHNWATVEKELVQAEEEDLSSVLLVSPTPLNLPPLPQPPMVVVERPPWLNSSSLSPLLLLHYQTHILLEMTMQAVPVVVTPSLHPPSTCPSSSTSSTTVTAGKVAGQRSPSLDLITTDGSFAAFNLFVQMRNLMEFGGDKPSSGVVDKSNPSLSWFLQKLGDPRAAHPVTWSWASPSFLI